MRAFASALAALALAASGCATPADPGDNDPPPVCLEPLPITEQLVRDAGAYDFSAFTGSSAAPQFIEGGLSSSRDNADDHHGSVLFVRDDAGAWRAVMPQNGEGTVGIYASESGELFIFTMWQTEGPGGSWTVLRSSDGLRTATCTNVRFPASLNEPVWDMEFLDLHDFDLTQRGLGEIVGVARTERRGELWFVYQTRDNGASWGQPQRMRHGRDATGVRFTKLNEDVAPLPLVEELRRYAQGR